MVPFAHLHVHSEYSLLDGACRIEQLVERVSDLGQTSCALTDHGVMYGVIDFYRACKAKGIHPVIGCEVYLAPHSRHERGYVNGEWHSHLILLCENMTGYKNLIHMVSAAFSEGFYMKPRIDMELLRGHSEGLICMSACLAGAIPRAIANGNMDEAYEICEEFLEIFDREHFYLEIQDHGIEEQKKVNEGLYQLAKELNLELVATNDAHYLTRADARTQDILMAHPDGQDGRRPDPHEIRDAGVLHQGRGRNGGAVPGASGGAREHGQDRGAVSASTLSSASTTCRNSTFRKAIPRSNTFRSCAMRDLCGAIRTMTARCANDFSTRST